MPSTNSIKIQNAKSAVSRWLSKLDDSVPSSPAPVIRNAKILKILLIQTRRKFLARCAKKEISFKRNRVAESSGLATNILIVKPRLILCQRERSVRTVSHLWLKVRMVRSARVRLVSTGRRNRFILKKARRSKRWAFFITDFTSTIPFHINSVVLLPYTVPSQTT